MAGGTSTSSRRSNFSRKTRGGRCLSLARLTFFCAEICNHAKLCSCCTRNYTHDFDQHVETHLKELDLRLVAKESLMQMRLLIFAHIRIYPHINQVEIASEATGLFRLYGNKGGIVMNLRVHETSIAFINCHLAAHAENVETREEDIKEIFSGARVAQRHKDLMSQNCHVFLMGDLNYRLWPGHQRGKKCEVMSEKRHDEVWNEVVDLVNQQLPGPLLLHDQLKVEMETKKLLPRFRDSLLERPHMPTFKVIRERPNDGADSLEYNRKRIPSYTDRVLCWSQPALAQHVRLVSLKPIYDVVTSDHKPVHAQWNIEIQPRIEPRPSRLHTKIFLNGWCCQAGPKHQIGWIEVGSLPPQLLRPVKLVGREEEDRGVVVFPEQLLQPLVSVKEEPGFQLLVSVFSKKKKFIGSVISRLQQNKEFVVDDRLRLNGMLTEVRLLGKVNLVRATVGGTKPQRKGRHHQAMSFILRRSQHSRSPKSSRSKKWSSNTSATHISTARTKKGSSNDSNSRPDTRHSTRDSILEITVSNSTVPERLLAATNDDQAGSNMVATMQTRKLKEEAVFGSPQPETPPSTPEETEAVMPPPTPPIPTNGEPKASGPTTADSTGPASGSGSTISNRLVEMGFDVIAADEAAAMTNSFSTALEVALAETTPDTSDTGEVDSIEHGQSTGGSAHAGAKSSVGQFTRSETVEETLSDRQELTSSPEVTEKANGTPTHHAYAKSRQQSMNLRKQKIERLRKKSRDRQTQKPEAFIEGNPVIITTTPVPQIS